MKRAFISKEQTDLNPTHLKKASASLKSDQLLSSITKEKKIELLALKNQTLSRNKSVNVIILILGNIAVILLLLFIYYTL